MNEDAFLKRNKKILKVAKIFKNLPKERKDIINSLIQRAVFMEEKLTEMEGRIDEDGVIVSMQQGDYSIDRAHPLIAQYNTTVKNYAAIIKQLCEQASPEEANKVGESLLNFALKK